MSLSSAAETALLNHIFKNAAWTGVGDAGGLLPSSVAGSLYVSLHTADPGEGGTQSTSEVSYSAPYARQAVARSAAGWTVSGNNCSNAAAINFPACTGGATQTATHFGIGTSLSGAGQLLVSGPLNSSLDISNGIQPIIPIGDLDVVAS